MHKALMPVVILESMEFERVRLCQIKETVIVREEAFLKLLALLQQQ
jgi:hypothetical protein